jgi:methylenetetrahydrofolate dehydrogenase (NADP+)/methenyltetrahydrofolate cyclohydrolase
MTIIFDGRDFARHREDELYHKVLKRKIKPVMATVLVGDNPASRLYVSLKQKAALRIGAEMDIYEYPADISKKALVDKITHLARDKTLSGIMIQLPLPKLLREFTSEIIEKIPQKLDVDGLREDSPFVPATARAVMSILSEAAKRRKVNKESYCVVVGAKGAIGSQIVRALSDAGFEVGEVGRNTDPESFIKETRAAEVLVSVTGSPGIITADHVKKGAVVIDVGSPQGDVDFRKVSERASFVTPVPGGVGPVTVVSLLENLVEAAYNTDITHTRG